MNKAPGLAVGRLSLYAPAVYASSAFSLPSSLPPEKISRRMAALSLKQTAPQSVSFIIWRRASGIPQRRGEIARSESPAPFPKKSTAKVRIQAR